MKTGYSTIVFDLGNTLVRVDYNISATKIANLFRIDSKKIYDMFFDSEISGLFEKGLVSPKEFYRKVSHLLGIKLPYKDFTAIWNGIFREEEKMYDLVRRLKKDYKLFLLSNVNRLHFEYIRENFDVINMFDEVILSYMVGARKPDKVIFEYMVKLAGGDRTMLLFIDDREDLIKESMSLGIDSIRFEGADKLIESLKEKKVI